MLDPPRFMVVIDMTLVDSISGTSNEALLYSRIIKLWNELEELKGFGFPHLVGSLRIEGGRIVDFDAEIILMRGLRESIVEDAGVIEFMIPIEKSAGPEALVKKILNILGV